MPRTRAVTLVSHGPNCLDGLTSAVVGARYFAGRPFEAVFASNREVDGMLRSFDPPEPEAAELWVTDISWHDERTTDHLNELVDEGLELYWVDHHKSAIDARAAGGLDAHFTDFVLDDSYSASRLLYEYLCERTANEGQSKPGLLALRNLVMLADDVDRWVLDIDGSRELALTVRAMPQADAYRALLSMDSNITYSHELKRARDRMRTERRLALEIAGETRRVHSVDGRGVRVVAAECEGYAGEVAESWQAEFSDAVFALYDRRGDGISFRRTTDCDVDLSRLAANFGGGGHAAAAGCEVPLQRRGRADKLAGMVSDALAAGSDR